MKTIEESNTSFPAVETYEQTDPFPGVPRAIEKPSRSLAARTEYLKKTVDDIVAGGLFTVAGDLGGSNTSQTVVGINGTPIKAGSVLTNGKAFVMGYDGELESAYVFSKFQMGDEGCIPVAGQEDMNLIYPGTRGWALCVADNGNPDYRPVSGWQAIDVTATAPSTSSLLVSSLLPPNPNVSIGSPVRVFDKTPIVYNDSYGNYAGIFAGIGGSLHSFADSRGRIYPSLIADGSGYFHLSFYKDAARTQLFGHTGTFNAVGTVAFVPDNGHYLSGTVTIAGTLAANSTAVLQCYKYLQVTAISGATVTLAGPTLSTGVNNILAVWIGGPEKIRPLDIVIQGAYAGVTSSQAIQDRTGVKTFCDFSEAHLVSLKAVHLTADTTTAPKVSMVHNGGLTVADGSALSVSTSRVSSGTEVIDNKRAVSYGQPIELRVQKLGTGDAMDLSAVAVYVLE